MATRASGLNGPKRPFRDQKRQTRLQFSSLSSSPPGPGSPSPRVSDLRAGTAYKRSNTLPRRSDEPYPEPSYPPTLEAPADSHLQSHERSEELHQTLFPSSPTVHRVLQIDLSDGTDEDDLVSPAQKKRKSSSILPPTQPTILPSARKSKRLNPDSSPGEHEDSQLPSSSSPRRRSGRLRRMPSPSGGQSSRQLSRPGSSRSVPFVDISSPAYRSTFSDIGSPETSDDDDPVMTSKPTTRRKARLDNDDEDPCVIDQKSLARSTPKRKKSRGDDFVVDDEEVEFLSSEDENDRTRVQPPTKLWRLKPKHRSSKASRRRAREEQDELEEDLHDLQDSVQEVIEPRARTRGGPVTTQRDKAREHLQLLKRRRAGEKIPRVRDSDEESDEGLEGVDINFIGQPHLNVSSDQSSDPASDVDQVNDDEDGQEEDDDDFVVDDSKGRLGRPHSDMPLQFTSFASAKPRELFPHIIEWMVKNKIAPAFNRDDPVYNLAFDRLDDQVKAQAGSRLISAAWGTDFKRAILARPTMEVVALPGEDDEHMRTCDACNRTNNPARYEFVFSGAPYYKKTLEPVDNEDEGEDEGDEHDANNTTTYDENGHAISAQQTRFYLGRFCAANAEMGHKLTHWKYRLNESLMTYLKAQGVLSADAIVSREQRNKRKREKEAEKIVDSMQETGVIAEFWREFENDLNDARLGMEDFEKRGGRSKGRVGAIRVMTGGLVREWNNDKYRLTKALESDSEQE
ncbi:hypothetical protein AYO21_02915 [Fonsecaea monophora]|uniref:DUF4211 domain-containing protein n=1 Tax=Fonsecaea monophora TaxID=254056 RepID=A0A177FF95_9EURO|nr:hypothetical protein AYO21_02915 [Fonsecaea monophora]KAH0847654.1 hypothetical protein FOPE_00751 [Fonsecaea pedrosoi]OAG42964.1 hypothetical protein AYO21_02915 [Fonsecaea monophora]